MHEVARLLEKGLVVISGIVLMELVQGALNEKEQEKILTLMAPVDRVDPSIHDWEKAGQLSYRLRKKGLTVSTLDVLMAFLAMENGFSIYSEDKHFEMIARHSDLKLHQPD